MVVDVSSSNGRVDWRRVRAAGIGACYLKASEGVTFDDRLYLGNRDRATAAGLNVGAYHYARPDLHPSSLAEAEHFCKVVSKLGPTDLRPALDLEVFPPGWEPARLEEWAREFTQRVKFLLGTGPLFYSYSAFIARMRLGRPIGYGLWLAAYGRDDGSEHPVDVPAPWRRNVAHQFTSRATVAGIPGLVDLSHAVKLRPLLAHPDLAEL